MTRTIEFLSSRSGQLTACLKRVDGSRVTLHSTFDPVSEAVRLVEGYKEEIASAAVVVVLGLGLGYHVDVLCRYIRGSARVLVVEQNEDLIRYYAQKAGSLLDRRVVLTPVVDDIRVILHACRRGLSEGGGCVVIKHPPSFSLDPEFYGFAFERIRDYLLTLLVDINTSLSIGTSIQSNTLKNLSRFMSDPGVDTLAGSFKDRPAIIVAAGPSLAKNVKFLHSARDRAVLIAVGTSLRPLHQEGIDPDFVVSLDPSVANYRLFAAAGPGDSYLCYEPQTHPDILTLFEERRFCFFSFNDHLRLLLRKMLPDKGSLPPGGSVAITAYGLARLLGANPIIFVGQDLAYTGGYTHARGTVYENQRVASEGLIEVPAIGGGKVCTSPALKSFLIRFEELFLQDTGRLIIDATEGGALKRGTQVMKLSEAIDVYCKEMIPVRKVIEERGKGFCFSGRQASRLYSELRSLERRYKKLERLLVSAVTLAGDPGIVEVALALDEGKATGLSDSEAQVIELRTKKLAKKLEAITNEAELLNYLDRLLFPVELLSTIDEKARYAARFERVRVVYGLCLRATRLMRSQLASTIEELRNKGDRVQMQN